MTTTPYADAMAPLSPAAFNELVASIEKYGVLVPILVDEQGLTVDGHQRLAASMALGIAPPHTVLDLTGKTDDERRVIAIAINAVRRQMSVTEQRQAMIRMKELGMKPSAIAKVTGKSKRTVERTLAVSGATSVANETKAAEDEAIATEVEAGSSLSEAAEKHGVSKATAHRATKRVAASKTTKAPAKKKEKPKTQPRITEFLRYLTTVDATRRAAELRHVDERLHEFFVANLIDCQHNHP